MYKSISFAIFFMTVFGFQISYSQTPTNTHGVLLMPFNPELYLSDAEQDIIKHTTKSPEVYREYFRKALDLKILGELKSVVSTISLLQDTSLEAVNDIKTYYHQCGYKYDNPIGKTSGNLKDEKEKKSPLKKQEKEIPAFITTRGDSKFMNGEVTDLSFFKYLIEQSNADILVSINQFEIKTNYSSCLDMANKVYQRELIIHYSIINKEGKVIAGNCAVTYFPSNKNKLDEIVESTFPDIARILKEQLLVIIN